MKAVSDLVVLSALCNANHVVLTLARSTLGMVIPKEVVETIEEVIDQRLVIWVCT